MRSRLTRVLAVLALLVGFPSVASGSDADMQERIDAVMAREPGGTQTAWNAVSWDGGDVQLVLDPGDGVAARGAVGQCPSGKHCVFAAKGGTGTYLALTSCSATNVSKLGYPVASIANARSSGNVLGKNGSTTVMTVAVGAVKNVPSGKTVTTVQCN